MTFSAARAPEKFLSAIILRGSTSTSVIDRVNVVEAGVLADEEPAEGFDDELAAGVVEVEVPVLLESLAIADTGRRLSAIREATNIRFIRRGYDPLRHLSTQKHQFLRIFVCKKRFEPQMNLLPCYFVVMIFLQFSMFLRLLKYTDGMKPHPAVPVSILADDYELGKALATHIFSEMSPVLSRSERYVLGCPGGRSPRSTYQALSELISAAQLSLENLYIAMMDEYAVQEPDGTFRNVDSSLHFSCKRFAEVEIRQVLNARIPESLHLPEKNVLVPNASNPAIYEETLQSYGIDLFLLASGASDGHVAFNGVGSPLEAKTRVTALSVETRTDNLKTFPQFTSLEEVPVFGVTVGPLTISTLSKSAVMILQGAHKSKAFHHITNSDAYNPDWPASIIAECKNPQIFADESASSA